MHQTIFHFAGNPEADLMHLAPFAKVHWMLPAMDDGTFICALDGDLNGAARSLALETPGVAVLPSKYSPRPLKAEHLAKVEIMVHPSVSEPTTADVLAEVFKRNSHPIFDPDS